MFASIVFYLFIFIYVVVLPIVFLLIIDTAKKMKLRLKQTLEQEQYANFSFVKKEMASIFYSRRIDAIFYANTFLFLIISILVIGLYALMINFAREEKSEALSVANIITGVEKKYFDKYTKENNIDPNNLTKDQVFSYGDSAFNANAIAIANELDSILPKVSKINTMYKNEKSLSGLPPTWQFVYNIVIKLSISFFGFFLIQLFVRLYRYNLRVGDFYQAKFEALISTNDLPENFKDAIQLYKHDIDIGNSPKAPIESIIELVKIIKTNG